jgi:hypothetical protein
MTSTTRVWRFLSTPPGTYEPGWRLTRRWALRVLNSYVIAALCGGLLFVVCAGLLAVLSPRGTPINPTIPIPVETEPPAAPPPIAPPDILEASPQVAGLQGSIKLAAIAHLLENKDKDPQAIKQFTDQAGFAQKYPLGFALFYSDGRKVLYYGKPNDGGISFDPSSLTVTRTHNTYCMNILPVRIRGKLLDNIRNVCVVNISHLARVDDVVLDIEVLAGSDEGAAWILGMKPAP